MRQLEKLQLDKIAKQKDVEELIPRIVMRQLLTGNISRLDRSVQMISCRSN